MRSQVRISLHSGEGKENVRKTVIIVFLLLLSRQKLRNIL